MTDQERARIAAKAMRSATLFAAEVVNITEKPIDLRLLQVSGVPRTLRAHLANMRDFVRMLEKPESNPQEGRQP
jgi:hypothetical protein